MPSALKKISDLKKLTKNKNVKISVDGGINFDTIYSVVKAGSDIVVAGNSVFKSGLSISRSIKKLKMSATEGSHMGKRLNG